VVGFGVATPLSQINFLPDLMHVNLSPAASETAPAFEQVAPDLVIAAIPAVGTVEPVITKSPSKRDSFFMARVCQRSLNKRSTPGVNPGLTLED
jgi:hypothetical protein